MNFVGDLFLLLGALFTFLGAMGLIRMPDVYSRIQAGTKAVTLGLLSILLGVALHQPEWIPKLLIIALFVLLTNPVGSSVLARAFLRSGIKPVKGEER
ncbi:MAG: monovalent cation/H(+) antiporter subunit G [Gammaproteobacteria bacterium]|nr:monovalent cation/H(+) antiporter subunit G [Gammaproteobacteria bacterium]MBT3489458.1 monovalent cation/H(+) antiporter subunit G [Gammaproteobacteria bacterium]MBT3718638.1 monovalent cation/H(+) antiporter subunit G [Gammaproteobacteria bacterium]MBT3844767.1 monovalent cation/H(+) antiporter subunit G [Gammaproteobacteria bacterium]MBT3892822.1 monovalent cation/H(+) antiporter subunit G [Gammaproteobacteria bacterium]